MNCNFLNYIDSYMRYIILSALRPSDIPSMLGNIYPFLENHMHLMHPLTKV